MMIRRTDTLLCSPRNGALTLTSVTNTDRTRAPLHQGTAEGAQHLAKMSSMVRNLE